jgi:Zn-dependent protease
MSPDPMAHLREGLILYIILAASIALHEYGHAQAADLLGDFLPRRQGRVTLNPLVHLDPIGTGLIPLAMILLNPGFSIIGWGRPVQISLPNPKTRVRDEILITLAGPLMNVLIALTVAVGYGLLARFAGDTAVQIAPLANAAITVNCTLIAFNMIPLPPLDGSRIMRHVVGMREETFVRLSLHSWWILLILINLGPVQEFVARATYDISIPFLALGDFLAR